MTITGYNFSPEDSSNNVFVGDAMNNYCTIIAATQTEIICEVPKMHQEYSAGDAVNIIVTGRIVEESICEGTCTFSYDSSETTFVQVPSELQYLDGEMVQIESTNNSDISNATVQVGGIICQIENNNNTFLEFAYPALPAGAYEVEIRVSDAKTYPSIITRTPLDLYSLSRRNGSVEGHRVTFNGQGYPNTDERIQIKWECEDIFLPVHSLSPIGIVFEIPPKQDYDSCTIRFEVDGSVKSQTYTYISDRTLPVTLH